MSASDALSSRLVRTFVTTLRAAWTEYERDYARYFAGAMVYYALVSLIPLLFLMLAGLGLLLHWSEVARTVEQRVLNTLEVNFGLELRAVLDSLLQQLKQGSVLAMCVSLGGVVLAASALFGHLRMTFRALWKHAPPLVAGSLLRAVQATFLERTIALVMVIAAGGLLAGALTVIAMLHWLVTHFDHLSLLGHTVSWLLILSPTLVVPITFGLLLMFLPPARLPWRDVWLATLICSAVWLVGTELLMVYFMQFTRKFGAYGALGGLLVFMLWIHALSKMLFFAGELCKITSVQRLRKPHRG